MRFDYRVSLWNYEFYSKPTGLEEAVQEVARYGYGVEVHEHWRAEQDLCSPCYRERLRVLLKDVPASLHSGGVWDFGGNAKQIDCAAYTGMDTVVIHPPNIGITLEEPDYALARRVVQYAEDKGVLLALENSPFRVIEGALSAMPSLRFCLDVGHCYADGSSIPEFLDAFGDRLVHLHLQDRLSDNGRRPWGVGHFTPGTGTIPREHWQCLADWIQDRDFRGPLVFEIRPLPPTTLADEARAFIERLCA